MSASSTFQREVRAWLEDNCPPSIRQPVRKLGDTVWAGSTRTFPSKDAELWYQRMLEKAWIMPGWPSEYGGGGLSPEHARVLEKEMASLHCPPPVYDLGQSMFGPVILEIGTEQQKREHITRIARGEVRWCQGYSEPGAGSDLASLQTRAEARGDYFLVNGTKLWTTSADKADWMFCLVRTDFDSPKHNGISVLLIDMRTPGISTAPIELISGESEFCQTFLDDVEVPRQNLLGELNKGWSIAKRVLEHERKLMSSDGYFAGQGPDIVDIARTYSGVDEHGRLKNPAVRSALTRHLMLHNADLLNGMRMYYGAKAGKAVPDLALTMKYTATTLLQRRDELLLAILGNRGLSWQDAAYTEDERSIVKSWAMGKAYTIAGGSSEIQLNIIAKRVLGLPSQ